MRAIRIFSSILVLLTTVQSRPSSGNRKESKNIPQSDKVYEVYLMAKVNWFSAHQICSYQGLTLASINSEAENKHLQQVLAETGLKKHGEAFWISGSNLADWAQWVWFSSGRPIAYDNWEKGQPNNYQSLKDRCMQIKSSGQWNQVACDKLHFFVCEARNLKSQTK